MKYENFSYSLSKTDYNFINESGHAVSRSVQNILSKVSGNKIVGTVLESMPVKPIAVQ